MAIENLDWYQQVDMSYIDLGNGYKIKFDYLLIDEMNLYLVLDFESENDISKFKNISLSNLKITNENNITICDRGNMIPEQVQLAIGDKLIEKDEHHMKSLIYMYTDSFPISKTLNISFSEIALYTKKSINSIKYQVDFKLDLSEKFVNRSYTSYSSNESKIKKAIVTETGFYAIIETENTQIEKIELVDNDNFVHECYTHTLSNYNDYGTLEYIVISDFNNIESERLKLIMYNNEIELLKS